MSQSAVEPTPRMKHIYRHYADRWGESEHMIWFDPAHAKVTTRLPRLHVAAWPADEDCDVTTLITLGVSDVELDRCDRKRIEFHWAVRGHLSKDQIQAAAGYLANLAEYPFDHGRCLDWWHRLNHPGSIPFFPDATTLLLRPPFSDEEQGELCFSGEHIRMLYVVPLNETEARVLSQDGVEGYEHYIECNRLDPLGNRS